MNSKSFKRIGVAALLSVSLLLAAPAGQAIQALFSYSYNGDGTVTLTGVYYPLSAYHHLVGPVAVPSTFNGLPVTSIGPNAFGGDDWAFYFTSVTIPASITNIEGYAFEDCVGLTSIYFQGNAPAVYGPYEFETHSQGNTTAYYLAGTTGWDDTTNVDDISIPISEVFAQDGVHSALWNPQEGSGSLEVTITPAEAARAGAQWQLDGGTTYNSGAKVGDLTAGDHTVTFIPVPGWNPPPDQAITIKNSGVMKASGDYKTSPPNSATLALQISGDGVVSPNDNGKPLQIGQTYKLAAIAAHNSVFSNWVVSGSENFVSDNPVLTFTMLSNLLLQANFVPTPFANAKGTYIGLFMPDDGSTNTINNSGFFSLAITDQGAFSGYLETAHNRKAIAGHFDDNFDYTNTISLTGEGTVTLSMNLDEGAQLITGSLAGDTLNAAIMAEEIAGGKVVYTETGRYSIALADGDDESTGTAVLNFTKGGPTTLAGRLPDGTKFSTSSVFCPYYNADWPFFTPLDGGKGCLLGRMYLADGDPSGNFTLIEPSGDVIPISASDESAP